MAILVVGGQARRVGKTRVVSSLIAATPERRWTAIKITQHDHGLEPGVTFSVSEEKDPAGQTDTARYLAAGARRSLLIRAVPGHLADAIPALRRELARTEDAILESNSVLEFLDPDVYLAVLDAGVSDFKSSARRFLRQVTAVVLTGESRNAARWDRALSQEICGKPIFRVCSPQYLTPDLLEFVRKQLAAAHPRAER